ncbi:hypothetical protein RISK_000090 [Rhodopirellula islandica]|uniref:Uncharacterized protein n=1 Tax=Rhodopirellula islandica TaxID=595434 RepID=A0A0J1BN68_RHOIS|nr:hypothetical protein RISK_000090 [Rhodopirellula islandica]
MLQEHSKHGSPLKNWFRGKKPPRSRSEGVPIATISTDLAVGAIEMGKGIRSAD